MPTYSYRCADHGVFDLIQRMKDHAEGLCPTCETTCKQVVTRAPGLDIEAMADLGMPGAFSLSGDRMTERHLRAGQYHNTPIGEHY